MNPVVSPALLSHLRAEPELRSWHDDVMRILHDQVVLAQAVLKRHFPYVMTVGTAMTEHEASDVESWLSELCVDGWRMIHLAPHTPPVVAVGDPDIAVAFRLRWC